VSKFVGFVESAFGGGRIRDKRLRVNPVAAKKLLTDNLDNLMGDIAKMSPTDIGILADDALSDSARGFRAIDTINFDNLRNAFKEAIETKTVTKKIKSTILDSSGKPTERIIEKQVPFVPQIDMRDNKAAAQKLKDLVDSGQILEGFDESKSFISRMAKMADSTDIEAAITNNSNLNALIRQLPDGSNAVAQMEAAYAFSRDGRKKYQTELVELVAKDVAKQQPEDVSASIFRDGGVTKAKNAKELLLGTTGKSPLEIQKGKTAWNELRWGWVRNQVNLSETTDKIPLGSKLAKAFKDMGEEALNVMFSPDELANLNRSIKMLQLVEKGATSGSGELIRFIQVGAAAGSRFGNKPGLAFAALGGPLAFARAMTKPNFHKALASNKIGQVVAIMTRTKLEIEKERKRIEKLELRDAAKGVNEKFTEGFERTGTTP
jgi:hypothetical protein